MISMFARMDVAQLHIDLLTFLFHGYKKIQVKHNRAMIDSWSSQNVFCFS